LRDLRARLSGLPHFTGQVALNGEAEDEAEALRGRQRRSIADHEPDFGLIVEFQVALRAAYMQRN
jgi:hypothetical protein